MFPLRSRREQYALLALGGLFLLGTGYIGAYRLRTLAPVVIQSVPYPATITENPQASTSGSGIVPIRQEAPASSAESGVKSEVVVDVAGAVNHPGVRHLPAGARVEQAIVAAGGPARNADLDAINQAEKLADGDMIRVPRRGESSLPSSGPLVIHSTIGERDPFDPQGKSLEAKSASTSRSRTGHGKEPAAPVSLNGASAEELETLPGVGPATAQKILEYRAAHGAFTSVEELGAIKGLGEKKLARLRGYVRL